MRRVLLTLFGLVVLSLLTLYAAVIEAPRIERKIQVDAVERLNRAGIAGVRVWADGRRLMVTGQPGVESNALVVLRQQFGVHEANWQAESNGSRVMQSTGIHSAYGGSAFVQPEASSSSAGGGVADNAREDTSLPVAAEAPASRDTPAVESVPRDWTTSVRLDASGLSIAGDSSSDSSLMRRTIERLRTIVDGSAVAVTAQPVDELPSNWAQSLASAATVLKEMGSGDVVLSDGQLQVSGTVQDRLQEQTIRRALAQLTPSDFSVQAEFRYAENDGPVEQVSAFACNANLANFMRSRRVVFERSSSALSFESFEVLDLVAVILSKCPSVRVEVAGFTDSRGPLALNDRISRERAEVVRQYLIDQGLSGSRILANGYGPRRPIASNDTSEGRALNRRIEFNVFGE